LGFSQKAEKFCKQKKINTQSGARKTGTQISEEVSLYWDVFKLSFSYILILDVFFFFAKSRKILQAKKRYKYIGWRTKNRPVVS
jgi:hypothetical protein